MAEIISLEISRKAFKKLISEANFDTDDEDWGHLPERSRGGNFLYRGNESKKIMKQTEEEEEWIIITERTPKTI